MNYAIVSTRRITPGGLRDLIRPYDWHVAARLDMACVIEGTSATSAAVLHALRDADISALEIDAATAAILTNPNPDN